MAFSDSSKVHEYTASGSIPTFPSSNPYVWARDIITVRTNKQNKISFFYKESLRYIVSKLGSLSYLSSEDKLKSIKCIHANPERTVAKLHQENNIILPVISIDQETSDNDDDRRRNSPSLILEKYWSEEKQRAFRVMSLAPRPVNISYGINIWAKYKSNMDQIVEQIRLMFNPHLDIKNPYTNVASAFIETEEIASELIFGNLLASLVKKGTSAVNIPLNPIIVLFTGSIP